MAEAVLEHVESQAQQVLLSSPIFAMRDLTVQTDDRTIFLSGRVDSFYHKQMAQELVRPLADGYRLVNLIEVSKG